MLQILDINFSTTFNQLLPHRAHVSDSPTF
jgi:hypothetical protein